VLENGSSLVIAAPPAPPEGGAANHVHGGHKKKTLELPAQAIRGIFLGPLTRTVLTTVGFSPSRATSVRGPEANHPIIVSTGKLRA